MAKAKERGDTVADAAGEASFKYTRYDEAPGSTHNLVVELVPEGSSVLEFGCATGYMSEVLVERRGARVTGIELDPRAADAASVYCERVVVGDAETLDLGEHLGDERFDAVLFADVLEHLRDPAAMLERVRPFVSEGGAVVASIPNIAHVSVRLALLAGEFRYRELGLLDDTHLRFFTRESIVDLFESAGFVVSTWRRRKIDLGQTEIQPPPGLPENVRAWLGEDPELTTYQFVVRAMPSDAASQLAELRATLRTMEAELGPLRERTRELENASDELENASDELELLRRAHEAQGRNVISERLSFSAQLAELDREREQLREEAEWRKGVMEQLEHHVATLEGSRTFRYTAPFRRVVGSFRRA